MKKNEQFNALEPLMLFIGHWKVEGKNLSSAPNSPETPLIGTQKVELMEGGKFIKAIWKYDYDKQDKHYGISIIGREQGSKKTQCNNFDNIGFHRIYDSIIEDRIWKLTGTSERATIEFDKNGNSYEEFWEIKIDGKWQPLCERKGIKNSSQ